MERIDELDSVCNKVFLESTAEQRWLVNKFKHNRYFEPNQYEMTELDDALNGKITAYEKSKEGTTELDDDPISFRIKKELYEILQFLLDNSSTML